MRLGLFSDAHPDWTTLGKSRFAEVEELMGFACERFVERRCALVCFLGDLCNPDRGPVVLRCARLSVETALRLSRAGIQSIWLAGNHDVFEDGSGCTSLDPLRALEGAGHLDNGDEEVVVVDRPESFQVKDVRIHCFPFTASSHPYDAEAVARGLELGATLEDDAPRAQVVLSHLHLEGIQPGEETKEMPRGRAVLLPHRLLQERIPGVRIFNGHYHRAQDFEGVHVVGSLARLTRGETGHEPTISIVEL